MKKILLSLLLVFGSLNMFAQDYGWVKKTSPITGKSWIQKSIVNEMGEETNYIFKIILVDERLEWVPKDWSKYDWHITKNNVGVHAWAVVIKGEKWEYFGSIEGSDFPITYDHLHQLTNSSLLRIQFDQDEGTLYYLDLKGLSIALKSL